jgi:hypothetical protein
MSYTDGETHNFWNVTDVTPAIKPLPCEGCHRRTIAREGKYCIVCMDKRQAYQQRAYGFLIQHRRRGSNQRLLLDY